MEVLGQYPKTAEHVGLILSDGFLDMCREVRLDLTLHLLLRELRAVVKNGRVPLAVQQVEAQDVTPGVLAVAEVAAIRDTMEMCRVDSKMLIRAPDAHRVREIGAA